MDSVSKRITNAKEFVEWADVNDILFNLTYREANVLLGYLEGHDYAVVAEGDQLFRVDLCEKEEEYEPTTLDDLIDSAYEWNFELIEIVKHELENPKDFIDYCNNSERLKSYRDDETILDCMYDRTIYGKQLANKAYNIAMSSISTYAPDYFNNVPKRNVKEDEKAAEQIAGSIVEQVIASRQDNIIPVAAGRGR